MTPVVEVRDLRRTYRTSTGVFRRKSIDIEAVRGVSFEIAEGELFGAGEFERRWHATAARWSFVAVNELIDRHNRWYPAEARLPMDPRSRDFVLVGGKPYRLEPLDIVWILGRFPPELSLAQAA